MKRFHVSLSVADLDRSVAFYTNLFGEVPTVAKSDYAKWMLDDPRINFSITTHGNGQGFDHLGLQTDSDAEFDELRDRLSKSQSPVLDQADVNCCYARSTKAWVRDPNEVPWETFISRDSTTFYGDGSSQAEPRLSHGISAKPACCSL